MLHILQQIATPGQVPLLHAGSCFYTPPQANEMAGLVGYFAVDIGTATYWQVTSSAP